MSLEQTTPQPEAVAVDETSYVEVKHRDTVTTAVTLANALELVTNVAEQILGGEVANTFSGSPMSRGVIHQLALSSFQKNIAIKMGN